MAQELRKATITHSGETIVGSRRLMPNAMPLPASTPITPPTAQRVIASSVNCVRIVFLGRADGLAHADLARTFGHAYQHDVHYADAAHQQRNA